MVIDHAGHDLSPLVPCGADDFFDDLAVGFGGQCACSPGAPGTRGSADAMQIDRGGLRGGVVEHTGDGGDVKAARGDVGSKEVRGACGTEGCQG